MVQEINKSYGKCVGVVVEHGTPNQEVLHSIPIGGTVLCP